MQMTQVSVPASQSGWRKNVARKRHLYELLRKIAASPNHFQVHAQGSLRLIDRIAQGSCEVEESISKCSSGTLSDDGGDANNDEGKDQSRPGRFVRGITCDMTRREPEASPLLSEVVPKFQRAITTPAEGDPATKVVRSTSGPLKGRAVSECSTSPDFGVSDSGSSSGGTVWDGLEGFEVEMHCSSSRSRQVSSVSQATRASDADLPKPTMHRSPGMLWEGSRRNALWGFSSDQCCQLSQWPEDVRQLLDRSHRSLHRWPYPVAKSLVQDSVTTPPLPEDAKDKLRLRAAAYSMAHPEKAGRGGGADSYFICRGGEGLGIADGVGEWEWRFGINARAFADELMAGCKDALESIASSSSDIWAAPSTDATSGPRGTARGCALDVLRLGFSATRSFGSSTALVAVLERKSQLGVASLGDSALLILRRQEASNFRVVGRTKEQQHAFNCPYQLSLLPSPVHFPELLRQGKDKLVRAIQRNPAAKSNVPEDAELRTYPVQEGDLVILGTDGVFDNLYGHEVCQLASRAFAPHEAAEEGDSSIATDPAKIAETIVKAAFHRSTDRNARTPFYENAKQAGLLHTGGKMDDITCVCAWVTTTMNTDE